MRYGRIICLTLFIFALAVAVVSLVFAQDPEAAVIVLPGSGSVGTGYTITLIGFESEEDVSLVITRAANDEIYFQTTLTTNEEGSASTVVHSQRDDPPGEYHVQASVADGPSASASFQILSDDEAAERSAPGPRYSEAIAIENGEWSGETSADTGIVAYVFTANAGDVLDAQLSSEAFDAYLVLLDADGAEVTMDDDSGMDLNAHIAAYPLPETGEYTLLATSWRFYHLEEMSSVGEFRLDFQLNQNGATAPSSAAPSSSTTTSESSGDGSGETEIAASLTEAEPLMRYSFMGRAGQSISARLRSDDFDPFLIIENSEEDTLISDDDGDGGLNARLEDFIIPEDGMYSIVVSSWEHIHVDDAIATGEFTLAVWGDEIDWLTDEATSEQASPTPEPPDEESDTESDTTSEETDSAAETETTNPPAPATEEAPEADEPREIVEIPITYGDRLSIPIGEDEMGLRYALAGTAGDRIDIAIASYSKLDTRIAVHSPDGTLLAEDDDSGRGYNPELLGLYLPEDGTYTIVLEPVWQGDGQPVSIAIDLREPVILADSAISIKLNSKQDIEVVSLTMESAGDIRLRAHINGDASDLLTFDAMQGGATLATLQHSGLREIEWRFAAPEAGEIRLLFGYHGQSQVSFTLEHASDNPEAETESSDE